MSEMGGLEVVLKALWGGMSNNLESVGGLDVNVNALWVATVWRQIWVG
jgi:hypothetical protein